SLKIDDQLEFGRLFDRKVARFSSLQDLVYVRSHASAIVLYARSIRHKPSGLYKSSVLVNGWQMLRCRELDDSLPITQSERIHKGQQGVREILAERCERTIEIGGRPQFRGEQGHPQCGSCQLRLLDSDRHPLIAGVPQHGNTGSRGYDRLDEFQ